MPCGGIFPIKPNPDDQGCWVCGQPGCDLFCEEWDTGLHRKCLSTFLASDEGRIVIEHGHDIIQSPEAEAEPEELPR